MCGIFGIVNFDGAPLDARLLVQGARVQRHRGPDDEGYLLADTRSDFVAACGGDESDPRLGLPDVGLFAGRRYNLAFAFRRLSIQDLSPAGHQPMSSADGRLWIVFNGEIYNYPELREELSRGGFRF